MKYFFLPLLLLMLYSSVCTAKAYTLEITREDRGFVFNSTLLVKGGAKSNHINIDGNHKEWRCSAWTYTGGNGLEVACHNPRTRNSFNVHSLIRCDSDDFMYLDGINMTCR